MKTYIRGTYSQDHAPSPPPFGSPSSPPPLFSLFPVFSLSSLCLLSLLSLSLSPQGRIEFVMVDWDELARGTCLEQHPEMIHVDPAKSGMKIQSKVNMLRLMILYQHGGVWVDTDTILLRDFRPLVAFFGEFTSRMTMAFTYNNNIISIFKRSSLAREFLELVCRTPYAPNAEARNRYCAEVGEPCVSMWWWNHGLFQFAVRRGLVRSSGVLTIMLFLSP